VISKIQGLLGDFGLSQTEVQIFLYLVGKGEKTGYAIAKGTKIHRSTCYDVLERLAPKGFILKSEHSGKRKYAANTIDAIKLSLNDKATILDAIAPSIAELEQTEEQVMRTYEGYDAQRQIQHRAYSLIKKRKLKNCFTISISHGNMESSESFGASLIEDLAKSKIETDIRFIFDEKFRKAPFYNQYSKIGSCRFTPELPNKVAIIIYGNYVSFLYTTDKPYAFEWKNALLADEMAAYFEIMWATAKE
jgi:sugar-specific transcriptional regulator TrmB